MTKVEARIGDKYELSEVLGRGAMGTVYAGKNLRTGRRVAIKSLHARGNLDPRDPDLLRFEQEARIAGSLESQHIGQVLDIDRDPVTGAPFLVMELLRGEDLQALIDRRGPLPADVALRIAAQACMGLVAAHAAGVVHRDMKPGNLFLARREEGEVVVKILDFGIAKIRRLPPDVSASALSGVIPAPSTSMTETGQLLGSPLYMSPEQVDGVRDIDARSDVFSLGVTLYAMLSGKAPHAEIKSFVTLLQYIATEPPPPLAKAAPWVRPEAAAIVERATRIAREERFPSAAVMLEAIRPLLSGGMALREEMLVASKNEHAESLPFASTEQASRAVRARSEENGSSRRRWMMIMVIVAVVMVLTAAAALLGR